MRAACSKTSTRREELQRRHLARNQAALHRPADRPQAPGAGRNLFQFRLLQHPAPQLLPQRFHFRAPGGLDRVHRDRRAGADLPRLLPGSGRPALHAAAHRHQFPAGAARSPTSTATSRWSRRAWPCMFGLDALEPNQQFQVLSSLFFRNKGAYIVGKRHQRRARVSVRHADPAQRRRPAGARHRADRPGADRRAVLVHARLLHGRHGSAVGLRAIPARPDAAQAAAARSTPSSACKSRARRCSTATSCST